MRKDVHRGALEKVNDPIAHPPIKPPMAYGGPSLTDAETVAFWRGVRLNVAPGRRLGTWAGGRRRGRGEGSLFKEARLAWPPDHWC